MRLSLHIQREIARLHFQDPGRTNREIARSAGVSPNTAKDMRAYLGKASMSWEALNELDDDQWVAALKNQDRSIALRKPVPDWQFVHDEMNRPDATLEQLWREFKEVCPEGVQYTRFAEGYKNWKKRFGLVMRRTHKPGEKLFVDFAGRTVTITNPDDGTTFEAQIFIAVLGYSNYTYIEAVRTQQIPDWVGCHVHCFEFLGGAPEWVISDRLKSAIIGSTREAIFVTPAYREAMKYYGTAPMPAGARKPKHKAKAEVGVQIAQRWVLFRLRDRTFFSIEELNTELRKLCKVLNEHPFKKLPGNRLTRFEQSERQALQPLPVTRYEYCDWRYRVLVGADHVVEHERRFYSVPHHLARESVDLRVTATAIEIMHRGRRVALHQLLKTPGEAHILDEHRPLEHIRVLEGEPQELTIWATHIGPYTAKMFEFHLKSRSDRTNGLLTAKRLRRLGDQYGALRLEEVCKYALPLNMTALRSIVSILKESPDKRSKAVPAPAAADTHENVRGPDYFGDKKS